MSSFEGSAAKDSPPAAAKNHPASKIGLSQRATSEDEERKEYDTYRDAADGSATLADLFHAKNNN